MSIVLHDLAGADPALRFSPYCWRTKFALAHKGLAFDTVPWRFTEKDALAFSGQDRVPALRDDDKAVSDSWAIALTNTVPSGATFTAGTTDLATGGGYTQGGNSATVSSATQSAGTYKLVLNSPSVWTGSGGGFTFRYALLVNSTNNIVVAYWDYGSSQAVAAGETVTVTLDGTNGVFQAT